MTGGDTVLVTGATGLIGAEVVARLAAASRPVAAVLHSKARIVRNDGTQIGAGTSVAGDIRAPASVCPTETGTISPNGWG